MRARKRSDYRTPERIAAKKKRDREYYERNRGAIRDAQKNLRLKLRYGITEQDYNEMAEEQEHACLICGEQKKLVVDHNHDTGEVRGLLCDRCNLRLGIIEDTEWLQKALSYLGVSV